MPAHDHPPRIICSHLLEILWRYHSVTPTQLLIGRDGSAKPQSAVSLYVLLTRHSRNLTGSGGRLPIVDRCRPYSLMHDGFRATTTIPPCFNHHGQLNFTWVISSIHRLFTAFLKQLSIFRRTTICINYCLAPVLPTIYELLNKRIWNCLPCFSDNLS
jgi:hypothetical protein